MRQRFILQRGAILAHRCPDALHPNKELRMLKKMTILSIVSATLAGPAMADDVDRAVEGVLGGAAGGLLLGPIGLVAGAVTGYTAGPAISHSWGLDRKGSSSRKKRSQKTSNAQ